MFHVEQFLVSGAALSGTAPLGFPFVDRIMVWPVLPALSLFLFSPPLLFFALFATVAHSALRFSSLRESMRLSGAGFVFRTN
jgi:hypothetical protein